MPTKPNFYEYLMKFIPDLSYIEFAEKDYWQQPGIKQCKPWYSITFLDASNQYYIQSHRCLIVSPVAISLNETNQDKILYQLADYGDRKIYAYFGSDDPLYKNTATSYLLNRTADNQVLIDNTPYILEVRF